MWEALSLRPFPAGRLWDRSHPAPGVQLRASPRKPGFCGWSRAPTRCKHGRRVLGAGLAAVLGGTASTSRGLRHLDPAAAPCALPAGPACVPTCEMGLGTRCRLWTCYRCGEVMRVKCPWLFLAPVVAAGPQEFALGGDPAGPGWWGEGGNRVTEPARQTAKQVAGPEPGTAGCAPRASSTMHRALTCWVNLGSGLQDVWECQGLCLHGPRGPNQHEDLGPPPGPPCPPGHRPPLLSGLQPWSRWNHSPCHTGLAPAVPLQTRVLASGLPRGRHGAFKCGGSTWR